MESEKIVYQGKIIEVVEQHVRVGNEDRVFELARRSPGTRLIIPTSHGTLLMTKERRREADGWDVRLPGGKVFDRLVDYNEFLKSGVDILPVAEAAARKEAREEVGIDARSLTHFATSHCGATVVWDLFYFVVTDFENIATGQNLEHGEEISIQEVTLDEAKELCLSGKMQEDRSVSVLLRYLHSIQR